MRLLTTKKEPNIYPDYNINDFGGNVHRESRTVTTNNGEIYLVTWYVTHTGIYVRGVQFHYFGQWQNTIICKPIRRFL